MSKAAIIGGGAAGMAAAIAAANSGHQVDLYEKNEKLGKKIYITGKGRCNLTNASDLDVLFSNIVKNPKFLYSALYGFDNRSVIDFFNEQGCATKIERGNRVFPVSDHSSDVIAALQKALHQAGVQIYLNTKVERICAEAGALTGVVIKGKLLPYDAVIVATGGYSYQTTGSTGDGYEFAQQMGHSVTKIRP
ncbi:MAG: aminoacetone oxidase family FAD-binding enzyme, partial [Lachnospiraceae bacterium]